MTKAISYLIETQLDEASLILAAKDIVSKLQKIAEQVAKMEAEDLMPLADAMRDTFGGETSAEFETAVAEQLRSLTETIRNSRNVISTSIDALENGGPIGATSDDSLSSSDDFFGGDAADAGTSEEIAADDAGDENELDGEGTNDVSDLGDLFSDAEEEQNAEGRLAKESVDHLVLDEYTTLVTEGKTASEAVSILSETYLMDSLEMANIIFKAID